MKFEKGKSGNPSGRPGVDKELLKRCRELCPEVVETWLEIMLDKKAKHADRIKAGENIFNRGYGTPVQSIDLEANVEGKLTQDFFKIVMVDPKDSQNAEIATPSDSE